MAESKDKLVYFNLRARAEATRMLYKVAEKEFVDHRFGSSDEFQNMKPALPFGQVPILETDHGMLSQSNVIARYVAKKLGLVGNDLWEEALHDTVVEASQDCVNTYAVPNIYSWKVFKSTPAPENASELLEAAKNKWVKVLNYVESIATGRGKKYIIGDTPGLAECWLYAAMQFCKVGCPELPGLTPWAKKFTENMEADPRIAKHLAERPESNL